MERVEYPIADISWPGLYKLLRQCKKEKHTYRTIDSQLFQHLRIAESTLKGHMNQNYKFLWGTLGLLISIPFVAQGLFKTGKINGLQRIYIMSLQLLPLFGSFMLLEKIAVWNYGIFLVKGRATLEGGEQI